MSVLLQKQTVKTNSKISKKQHTRNEMYNKTHILIYLRRELSEVAKIEIGTYI